MKDISNMLSSGGSTLLTMWVLFNLALLPALAESEAGVLEIASESSSAGAWAGITAISDVPVEGLMIGGKPFVAVEGFGIGVGVILYIAVAGLAYLSFSKALKLQNSKTAVFRFSMNIIAITAMSMLVFAVGCGTTGGGGGSSQGYLGGSQALDIQFMNGRPPEYIFDNGAFDFEVQIQAENMGEIDTSTVNMQLLGVQASLFGLPTTPSTTLTGTMEGRYLDPEGNVIPGTRAYWTWASTGGYTGNVTGNTPYTIVGSACFVYGSEAQAFLCYKSDDLLDQDAEAVCRVTETKSVRNAGSPIQITRLSQGIQGSSAISFTFDVSHSGNGQFYAPAAGICNDSYETENVVEVTVTSASGANLDCGLGDGGTGSTGEIMLVDGRPFTVRCTEDVPAGSNWEGLVTITTSYDYKQKINKQLIVKHSD